MRKTRSKNQQGVLITNGVVLEKHEYMTITLLLSLGYDIELIKPSAKRGTRTPDFFMNGIKWEMKSPEGGGKNLIKNTLQKAAKQSLYIIIDLRRTKRHSEKCLNEIRREFMHSRKIMHIKIITKDQSIIDIEK